MNWTTSESYIDSPSLIWGRRAGNGELYDNQSPLGHNLATLRLLSGEECNSLFEPQPKLTGTSLEQPTSKLVELIANHRSDLTACLRSTTGFSQEACSETISSCESFLCRFHAEAHVEKGTYTNAGRSIGIRSVPWGVIAAILPQNAFLGMALICLLNGLVTGNRVVLRAPSGSAKLAFALGELLTKAGFQPSSFSLVVCDASQFVDAWVKSSQSVLLHYMGSSARGPELLQKSFDARKPVLVDGEGNAWVYVDQDQDPCEAASLIWQGAVRYNGQTCTSVNGVFVHPDIEQSTRRELRELVKSTTFGLAETNMVGPLFTVNQAKGVDAIIHSSNGRLGRLGNLVGNLHPPTLIEDPALDSQLVKEGVFGPVMWIRTGDFEEFKASWAKNRYPLCAGILSGEMSEDSALQSLEGASRVVMNGDPSLEDPLEPWGAYPPCGSNPVSEWSSKYLRAVQLDRLA